MGLKEYFNKKKKQKLPLIAKVNLSELQRQREEELKNRETSILAAADYTKRIPTIRLYYVAFEKFTRYGSSTTQLGSTYEFSNPFRLPHNMKLEDAYKVISYLSDKVENENNLEPASIESGRMVSNILNDYGFEKVESHMSGHYHGVSDYTPSTIKANTLCDKIEGVIDLFSVGGDIKLFKKSDLKNRYFNWYTQNVTKKDIENIYKEIGEEHLLPNSESSENEKAF